MAKHKFENRVPSEQDEPNYKQEGMPVATNACPQEGVGSKLQFDDNLYRGVMMHNSETDPRKEKLDIGSGIVGIVLKIGK